MVRKNIGILILVLAILVSHALFDGCEANERAGEVTFKITINTSAKPKEVQLWLPYPVSDENQTIEDVKIGGNYSENAVYREKMFGNMILYSLWENPKKKEASLTFSFKVKRREVIKKDFLTNGGAIPKEIEVFLVPTSLAPMDEKTKELAKRITKGKNTIVAKARAIYDYLIDNMERDPKIVGCGLGDVCALIETKKGKCVDFHSVYVALARSAGVPAREVFGIRIPKGKEGNMTEAYHCWAEFYAPEYGWVPVDAADVRKIMLEKNIQDLEEIKNFREYYFGAVDENRIRFGTGRDIMLSPEQKSGRINYFMYPYAEVDNKSLDFFNRGDLKYEVSFKEIKEPSVPKWIQ
jgi:transglutaminase-like putative cysteine protease